MKPFEWGLVAGVLLALAVTYWAIKVDEGCAVFHERSFMCDVAHGYTRVMAPEAR